MDAAERVVMPYGSFMRFFWRFQLGRPIFLGLTPDEALSMKFRGG